MSFFDINHIFFTAWGYPMSYLEFFGTLAGGLAVWLSAKENIWSWWIGIINVILFFFLFYQIQLYPDMFLQVFFLITNLIGWWHWQYPKTNEANQNNQLKISRLSPKNVLLLSLLGLLCTGILGTFTSNLNLLFPLLFSKPSAFPYLDSFTTVMSIITTFLMIRKKVECWYMWLLIDLISTYMYFVKGVKFVGIEYAVFCVIALFGAITWTKAFNDQSSE
jgi:nicotinamide mononucleotide transporter